MPPPRTADVLARQQAGWFSNGRRAGRLSGDEVLLVRFQYLLDSSVEHPH
jgi:hypothetical protein